VRPAWPRRAHLRPPDELLDLSPGREGDGARIAATKFVRENLDADDAVEADRTQRRHEGIEVEVAGARDDPVVAARSLQIEGRRKLDVGELYISPLHRIQRRELAERGGTAADVERIDEQTKPRVGHGVEELECVRHRRYGRPR